MPLADLLGRVAILRVRRVAPEGAYLAIERDGRSEGEILLPKGESASPVREGDAVSVFVHLDSEDRPVATTKTPRLERGEVAFLRVVDVSNFGAFVDWGLMKDLLVPHAEQTTDLEVGQRHAVGLYVDKSGRLAGTMRVSELLRERRDFSPGEWVQGEAWRRDPKLGVFVIVERRFVGLLPASEPTRLGRGDAGRFRVANVLPDGKIELSERGLAHEEVETDARKILEALSRPRTPKVGDKSSPEEIRAIFGLSKKAFKRAVGGLLKRRQVTIDGDGWISPSKETP